jgi:fluoride exporter
MVTALAVAGGAALGAPCRYLLDRAVQNRHRGRFPWGILLINVLGSLVLGVLVGRTDLPDPVLAAAGTGWCGTFTTYSTFGHETVRLARDGEPRAAVLNVVLTVAGGLGAAALGFTLGRELGG